MQSNALQLLFEGQKLWLAAGREGSSSTADTGPPTNVVYAHLEKAGNGATPNGLLKKGCRICAL